MKFFVITLGYVSSAAWEMSCRSLYQTKNPDTKLEHYFLNQHYPLRKEQNEKELKSICDRYGIHWLDAGKNLGLSAGFNWALKNCGAQEEDLVIGYDPDNIMLSPGWDLALIRTILGGKSIGWVSLWNTQSPVEFAKKTHTEEIIDGHIKVWLINEAVVNSVCCWRVGDLRRLGGLEEVTKYYGGLECVMYPRFKKLGLRWGVLRDYAEDWPIKLEEDKKYLEWKWHYAHTGQAKTDFETWLHSNPRS